MPKMTDTTGRSAEEVGDDLDQAGDDLQAMAARKLAAALSDDEGKLVVLLRIKNNRLDYALPNRPDPTMSGVTDGLLMAALLVAGRRYDFSRGKRLAGKARPRGMHNNGNEIVYTDKVTIDFAKETMRSTRKHHDTLQALSIVVQNLAKSAAEDAPPTTPAN